MKNATHVMFKILETATERCFFGSFNASKNNIKFEAVSKDLTNLETIFTLEICLSPASKM